MSPDPAQFRAAVRALVAEPLTDRASPAFTDIRRHRRELTQFFADELGYRLDATRPHAARLAKLPGPGHPPRGLATRGGRRFDGRRYALVCLVMASAESAGEYTTLQRLFDDVALRAAGIDGLGWDGQVAADRRMFIHAVQALQDLRVFERADGDEERFARGEAGGDALYRIDRDRLSLLPTTAQPPSLAAGPADVAGEAYPDTEEGRLRRRRHRVTRALVEEPVVYRDDLTGEEIDYLRSQRGRLERLLADRFGLTLEVRAEGWVTIDESGELSDLRWPDYGAAETTALRLCDELRARHLDAERAEETERPGHAEQPGHADRPGRPGGGDEWPIAEVVAFVRRLSGEYAGYWKKGTDDEAGAQRLAEEAIDILVAGRLAVRSPTGLTARPAAARYAALDAARPAPTLAPVESDASPAPSGGAVLI